MFKWKLSNMQFLDLNLKIKVEVKKNKIRVKVRDGLEFLPFLTMLAVIMICKKKKTKHLILAASNSYEFLTRSGLTAALQILCNIKQIPPSVLQ